MNINSAIFLNCYASIFIFVFLPSVSPQLNSFAVAWILPTCNYEFEETSSTNFDGKEKMISQELFCGCGGEACSNAISYSHTETWTHSVGGELAPLEMLDALKGIFKATYSYSWGESATQTATVNCEIRPGTKVWLTIIPKMIRKTGWGQQRCSTQLSNSVKARGWVEIDAPVKGDSGQLVGQVWCRTAKFTVCNGK